MIFQIQSSCKSLRDPASCVFLQIPASFYASSCKLIHVFHAKKNQKNVTEILQHLHACNSNTEVFYGREVELKILKQYMQGPCNKPFVLYGKGGSGKTAMLSIAGSKGLQEWLKPGKPLLIIRYHSFQLSKLIPSADCFVLYFASSIITVTDRCCFVVYWIILLHSMWIVKPVHFGTYGFFRYFWKILKPDWLYHWLTSSFSGKIGIWLYFESPVLNACVYRVFQKNNYPSEPEVSPRLSQHFSITSNLSWLSFLYLNTFYNEIPHFQTNIVLQVLGYNSKCFITGMFTLFNLPTVVLHIHASLWTYSKWYCAPYSTFERLLKWLTFKKALTKKAFRKKKFTAKKVFDEKSILRKSK